MQGQPPEPDPGERRTARSQLRISDEDRHRVAEVLREAAGEGRLDLDELDERLEAAYAAKTYGDLVPITADLPLADAQPAPRPPAARPHAGLPTGPTYATSVAVMSTSRRLGSWVAEEDYTAFALMGSVVLDLRETVLPRGGLTVNAHAVMGDVKIIVGAGTQVLVEGVGVMGDYAESRPKVPFDPTLGGPPVRVRGMALMGTVTVQRKGPPGASLARRIGWSGR